MRLCDEEPGLELVRVGDHFRLRILDSAIIEIPLSHRDVKDVVNGGTVQVSYPGSYCKLDGQDGHVKITYALRSFPLTCRVSLENFMTALQQQRQ